MNSDLSVNIEDIGDDLYIGLLELVSFLIALDPPADSPRGKLLAGLADAMETYERATYVEFGG